MKKVRGDGRIMLASENDGSIHAAIQKVVEAFKDAKKLTRIVNSATLHLRPVICDVP